jgi:hypothetical protein
MWLTSHRDLHRFIPWHLQQLASMRVVYYINASRCKFQGMIWKLQSWTCEESDSILNRDNSESQVLWFILSSKLDDTKGLVITTAFFALHRAMMCSTVYLWAGSIQFLTAACNHSMCGSCRHRNYLPILRVFTTWTVLLCLTWTVFIVLRGGEL